MKSSGPSHLVGATAGLIARAAQWKIGLAAGFVFMVLICCTGFFMTSSSSSAQAGECVVKGKGESEIPANYIPWLKKATLLYKLGPKGFFVVAAIHYVESDFGRSKLPGVVRGTENAFGAEGPGQFLVPSWEEFGQDADDNGVKDIYGIPDSIYGTANYMHLSGAPKDWWGAIFAYNHEDPYVEKVFAKAKELELNVHVVCTPAVEQLSGVAAETVEGVEQVAKWIESKRIHYCWAGGHGLKPGPSEGSGEFCPPGTKGLDCSGSVRWLLVLSGFSDPGGLASDGLGAAFPSGPGKAVTIWANPDHVFITINGHDWGTSETNPFNGPGYAEHSHAGFVPSHPEGL